MFKKINAGGVVSDQGFSIQIEGPETLHYVEGPFEIFFTIGYNKQMRKIYIHFSEISCWNKYVGSKFIPKSKLGKLKKDLIDALALLEGDFEVI